MEARIGSLARCAPSLFRHRARRRPSRENLAEPGETGKNELSARRELHNVSPAKLFNTLVLKD
jgi:hypothetical protein